MVEYLVWDQEVEVRFLLSPYTSFNTLSLEYIFYISIFYSLIIFIYEDILTFNMKKSPIQDIMSMNKLRKRNINQKEDLINRREKKMRKFNEFITLRVKKHFRQLEKINNLDQKETRINFICHSIIQLDTTGRPFSNCNCSGKFKISSTHKWKGIKYNTIMDVIGLYNLAIPIIKVHYKGMKINTCGINFYVFEDMKKLYTFLENRGLLADPLCDNRNDRSRTLIGDRII